MFVSPAFAQDADLSTADFADFVLSPRQRQLVRAVEILLNVRGRVVVMGIGKSGHIGRKIAATLASTGTPAMFTDWPWPGVTACAVEKAPSIV